jgi:phage protein D
MGGGSALKPARPSIKVAGHGETSLDQGLLALSITEHQDGLYGCEATFGNWGPKGGKPGFLYFGRDTLEFGKDFEVLLDDKPLFNGRITAIEGVFHDGRAPELCVLAEDRFQDLRMTRRTRSFEDASDADVMRKIAGDHGLQPQIDVSGPTHKVVAQLNQSDLAFLRDRARGVDAELWLDGKTLSVKSHTKRNGERVRLGYGNELVEFGVLADLAHQRSSVTVTGWDVAGKQVFSELADDGALTGEAGSGDSGASILRTAIAERKELVSHPRSLGSAEARARAEALFRARARRFVRGHGVAQADARLHVGATVQLDGLGPLFSGDYFVTEATIRFEPAHGLRTHFAVERPVLGKAAA